MERRSGAKDVAVMKLGRCLVAHAGESMALNFYDVLSNYTKEISRTYFTD